jgi:hypothetical protein
VSLGLYNFYLDISAKSGLLLSKKKKYKCFPEPTVLFKEILNP